MITYAIRQIAFKRCQASWGGATFDSLSHQFVADNADLYVFATSETIELPEDVEFDKFNAAIDDLLSLRTNGIGDIGFFHDDAKGTIDLNLVAIVDSREDVDWMYELGYPMPGGAYHFATGDGYWPQGRPGLYT